MEQNIDNESYKRYTIQAKRWIKGEAFFEALISDYSLPHHIVSPKDVGIDYICEWVYGDRPTGILYAVQVKRAGLPHLPQDEEILRTILRKQGRGNGLTRVCSRRLTASAALPLAGAADA
ncbi:MAG: hypothetical protein ACRERE_19385 [Candidatus Entotheonellia bacterium]